jgi:hypothetical protein
MKRFSGGQIQTVRFSLFVDELNRKHDDGPT